MTELATEIDALLRSLFPITRSITGEGNRESLRILQEIVPLRILEYPSGTAVYDWTIPEEWWIRDAWIKDENGDRIVDFQRSNVHVVNYSEPVSEHMAFDALEPNLHYLPDLPEAIPYRTSYYQRNWGFCVNRSQYEQLRDSNGELEIHIDSGFLPDGSLTVGELLIPGRSDRELLLSTYICHPSLANDNLSGPVTTAMLARELLRDRGLEHSWRIIFVPETIGAIAYSAMNEQVMRRIDAGFVITTTGGPGPLGYKQSFDSGHPINRIVESVFEDAGVKPVIYPFDIHGSDERQYSSQGFRINTVSITKDKYYEYPYYHTSLDNLDFVRGENIVRTLELYQEALLRLDMDRVYRNTKPNCEVMLSKHDLYPKTGGAMLPEANGRSELDLRMWLLFLCDGTRHLSDIADHLDVAIEPLFASAKVLEEKGMLAPIDGSRSN